MHRTFATLLCAAIIAVPSAALSWGFKGHETVGAIADQIIARDHPDLQDRLAEILNGRPLRQVATFLDCAIIGFCAGTPNNLFASYVSRNKSHKEYHYTDVPVQRRFYTAGTAGTSPHDVVQILRQAVGVLRGQPQAAGAPANLTEEEAVWVLAHLVGDIHQPLHVGSIYFDENCKERVDPNRVGADQENFGIGKTVAETHGGGWLKIPGGRQLHKLWDTDAVEAAMGAAGVNNADDFARELIKTPVANWETGGDPSNWGRRWANEILPLAREALSADRLTIHTPGDDQNDQDGLRCFWKTDLKPGYDAWANQTVKDQITKAGFRLAAILRAAIERN